MAYVKVITPFGESELELPDGGNLLEHALQQGVELDWSCQNAECGCCQVMVLEGHENLSEPSFGEKELLYKEIEKGLRLACQTHVEKGKAKVTSQF